MTACGRTSWFASAAAQTQACRQTCGSTTSAGTCKPTLHVETALPPLAETQKLASEKMKSHMRRDSTCHLLGILMRVETDRGSKASISFPVMFGKECHNVRMCPGNVRHAARYQDSAHKGRVISTGCEPDMGLACTGGRRRSVRERRHPSAPRMHLLSSVMCSSSLAGKTVAKSSQTATCYTWSP